MNPISNCKVKQQLDFCKCDELFFRIFSPKAPPHPPGKKILSSWKIVEFRIFNQMGRKIAWATPQIQCILSIFKPHSFEYWWREQTPTHKTKFLKLFLGSIQSGGEPYSRMEISCVNPLPFNRQNQIHAGVLKRSFVLIWTPGASSWWRVWSPVHVSCGTFPVQLLHGPASAVKCASWRPSLALLRWPFL